MKPKKLTEATEVSAAMGYYTSIPKFRSVELTNESVVNFMPKDKKSVTIEPLNSPQASVRETDQKIKVRIIDDPKEVELGINGHLYYNERQILAVKGHDAAITTSQVYFRFARELDPAGKPFQLSLKKRGITHTSPTWKQPAKITGAEMLDYLDRWFIPAQLVSNANGQALLLLDTGIPATFAGMVMQPRYLSMFADLFTAID